MTAGHASAYSSLLREVRGAGLLRRRYGFYLALALVLAVLLAATAAAVAVLRGTGWELLMAPVSGLLLAQVGFLAHEAAHRQVFASGRANDLAALLLGDLVVGMSASWWNDGHSRHHAHPNRIGADPAMRRAVVSFTESDAGRTRGPARVFTRHQGAWFFPLLLLEGLNLHLEGVRSLTARGIGARRRAELVLLSVRFAICPGLLFVVLEPGVAIAFWGIQLAVFGLYLGASFAVNHIGMPSGSRNILDYLARQVVASRNIRSGRIMTAVMGGLNYQIEHHLFPSMPRPALVRASGAVRRHCAAHGLTYTEQGVLGAFGDVVRELDRVGLAASRHRWECSTARQLRGGG